MKIIGLDEATLGTVVARPVYDENMMLLVNRGVKLDQDLVTMLKDRGYKYIYIQEEGTEEIEAEDPISVDSRRRVAKEVSATFHGMRQLSASEKTTVKIVSDKLAKDERFANLQPKGNFRKNVKRLVQELYYENIPSISSFSLSMLGTNPLSHAMDVTMLAILLGKRFHFTLEELVSMASASLLHDTGLQVMDDIRDKPYFMLKGEEMSLYENHSHVGYMMLDSLRCFSAMEVQTVLQHHENQDGTGFPSGLKGDNVEPLKIRHKKTGMIFRWAEVLAVADRYINYCSGTMSKLPKAPPAAISAVIEESGSILNSAIVKELVNIINVFPLGTPVKVAESLNREIIGYLGVVAEENQQNMNRPVVVLLKTRRGQKIKPVKVDFSLDSSARMELALTE